MTKKHKGLVIGAYALILAGCVFAGVVHHNYQSSQAIASYDTYIAPSPKITRYYNPKYRYRFHPKAKDYLKRATIRVVSHVRINKPNTQNNKQATKPKQKPNNSQNNQTNMDNQSSYNHHLILRRSVLHHHGAYRRPTLRRYRLRSLTRRAYADSRAGQQQFKKVVKKERIYVGPKYRFKTYKAHKLLYVDSNYPIWKRPYRVGTKWRSSTNGLADKGQAVLVTKRARAMHHTFYDIESSGYNYGWVPKAALVKRNFYQMPFHYYSQLQPLNAPDACEAVSLRMALSVKGRNPKMSMKKFIKKIPRSHNPNKGYTHNPFIADDDASIYPKALAKYARHYDKHTYAYTGISKKRLIYELEHGNPIVYEGSYHMKNTDSDHTLVLIGYVNGDLEYADPYYKSGWHKPISWVSIHKFTKLFHQPLRGARAVVIK